MIYAITVNHIIMESGVYVIQCDDLYKLGRAESIKQRFGQFQTANPHPLELVVSLKCDYHEATKLERHLHKLYIDKKYRGEWFKFDKEDINSIIDEGQKFLNKTHRRVTKTRAKVSELKQKLAALKLDARAEMISVFVVEKKMKGGNVHKYWQCSWRGHNKENHSVYLGSCKTMSENNAWQKAKRLKSEYIST